MIDIHTVTNIIGKEAVVAAKISDRDDQCRVFFNTLFMQA